MTTHRIGKTPEELKWEEDVQFLIACKAEVEAEPRFAELPDDIYREMLVKAEAMRRFDLREAKLERERQFRRRLIRVMR